MRVMRRGQRRLSVLAGVLGVALAISLGGHCVAQTAQTAEEEDDAPDVKLLRGFLKDLGLKRDGDDQIEYRERAPLVVPPSRTLPPPQSGTVANNPAWPKDPDVTQRKREAAVKRRQSRTAAEAAIEDGRALRPNELDRGRVAAGAPVATGSVVSPEEGARPLRPAELGSKGLFGGLFTSFGPGKAETAPFTAEPPRAALTEPPPGYRTPSPNQPYGLSTREAPAKPATLESRAVGTSN